jgi:large subunit ribosomal protein L31
MKDKIHPAYTECKVTCGCGNVFVTRSTKPSLHVEICSSCHPFYTGKQKYVDTAGRVEKFQKRHSWDDAAMGKLLQKEKEAPKRPPRKLERVRVGLPRMKKKTAEEEALEEEAPRGRGPGFRGRGPRARASSSTHPSHAEAPPAAAPPAPEVKAEAPKADT